MLLILKLMANADSDAYACWSYYCDAAGSTLMLADSDALVDADSKADSACWSDAR